MLENDRSTHEKEQINTITPSHVCLTVQSITMEHNTLQGCCSIKNSPFVFQTFYFLLLSAFELVDDKIFFATY